MGLPGLLFFLHPNVFMVPSSLKVSLDGIVQQPPHHTSSLGSSCLSAGGSPSYHHPNLQNGELLLSL